MWLKNLTPVGLVSYLVTNYGYHQVLKLLDGNIEVAKAHLTTYFTEHDKEITPEQASYLGDCAMKVLQTAGQIAVHQVAARKFDAVRKVAKLKTRPGGIGKKGGAKISKVEWGASELEGFLGMFSKSSDRLKKAIPNPEAFLASVEEVWKQGAQGSLNNAGRALQKHASRVGSSFSDTQFSGKTANQDAKKLIKEILSSKNQVIKKHPQGGYHIFDRVTGRGIAVSRKGVFNGVRNMSK